MTQMNDGREIEFGKANVKYNVSHGEEGVNLVAAFKEGEYRTYTLTPEQLGEWAAFGLRAFAKAANLATCADFDAKSPAWSAGPFVSAPRSTSGPAANPLESALMQVTGKDLTAVRTFLSGKDRKTVNALKSDARIAPVYAALKAADEAARAAKRAEKKGEPVPEVDALADLA